jgi:hypothetical protein
MNKTKLSIGVVLVFLAGVFAGSLGMGIYLKHQLKGFEPGGHPPPPHERHDFIMKRLSNELDLTEAQRIEIEKIVEDSEAKIFAIRRQYLPEIKKIVDQSFSLMKDKLDPKQQEKLKELHERLKNRHARALIHSIPINKTPEQILFKIKEQLELTYEQETKLRPIIETMVEERRKIVDKYRKQDHPAFFSLEREMHALQESIEKRFAEILTEKQMEKYRRIQEKERFEKFRQRKKGKVGPFH